MLILGARAVLAAAKNKTDNLSRWALALEERRGYWKVVVATAAQHALVDSQVVRYLRDHRARLTAQPPASRMNSSVKRLLVFPMALSYPHHVIRCVRETGESPC